MSEERMGMNAHDDSGRRKGFLLSLGLTFLTFIFELVGGLWTGSLALLSDSAHVFLDIFALGISYLAIKASARRADDTHSYGFHRLEVLAALINGLTLLAISVGIFYETWKRWSGPNDIKTGGMLGIAVAGLVVNLVVARVLHGHEHNEGHAHQPGETCPNGRKATSRPVSRDLNVHSAYLHVIGDAVSSIGVILAAILIRLTGWTRLDPLMSAVIGLIILAGSFRVLKSAIHILVEGVPEGLKTKDVLAAMLSMEGVKEIHDLHIWNICSDNIALSAHIVTDGKGGRTADDLIRSLDGMLAEKYGIGHATIQVEMTPCTQDRC